MAVGELLNRLHGVRKTGADSWLARCPAHPDRTPSLTVRALQDGRVLVHCFAGCGAADVVESIGLRMADLMPERLGDFVRAPHPFSAMDALRALRFEGAVLALAASDMADGKGVDPDRIAMAAGRIAEGLEYVNGR